MNTVDFKKDSVIKSSGFQDQAKEPADAVTINLKSSSSNLTSANPSPPIKSMVEPNYLSFEQLKSHNIIYPFSENTKMVDQYRELRTSLLELYGNKNKITMVCSVLPGGGSTHVAVNLAAAFAFDEMKTALLMDCNLRNSALAERLYVDADAGLTDFLHEEVMGIDNIIYPTGIARLRLIPTGKSTNIAPEHFTSNRMRDLLDLLKDRYQDRYIFLDAPPLTYSADAKILAGLCDHILLVVPYGRVLESQLEATLNVIGKDKIAGVILNQ